MKHITRAVASPLESRWLFASPVVIDVLGVYTPGAVTAIGSVALLKSRLQDSIDAMNRAMSNSRIAVSVRLVHVDPVTYTGQQDLYLDRTALEAGTGGLSAVAALRNTYGADLVTMIVENQYGGGNASLMTSLTDPQNAPVHAFSAIAANSIAPYNDTIAHELGHNLGAGHERGNPDGAVGPFPYSYGYRFTGTDGVLYHDIMSYDPGTEIPYYANPAVSFHGTPTGAPVTALNRADLAATFAQTAPIVSAYRASVVPDAAPTAMIDTLRIKKGFAYIAVRYDDDSGIDLSTVDSNDITITVLGLAATITPVLDSIENADVGGAFNRVIYRAYLRDVQADPTSIVVSMNANAVRDITGKAVPAMSALPMSTKWSSGYSYFTSRDLGSLSDSIAVGDALGDLDGDDVFKFTLPDAITLSVRLTGLSQDANVFIATDFNNDGVYQSQYEEIGGSFRGGTTDESLTLNLDAGTYYAWVFGQVVTPYTLKLSTYFDQTPPTAKLDATDIAAPSSRYLFNVAFDDDVEINAYTARYYSPVRITTPTGGVIVGFASAIDADVNGPHRVVTYQFDMSFTFSAADNGIYTVSLEPNGPPFFNDPLPQYVGDGANNKVASGTPIGTFRIAIGGAADSVAPTAVRTDAPQVYRGGATSYDFDVAFADNIGVTTASLMASQVNVVGPDGVTRVASATSLSAAPTIGSRRTVHYHLASLPGGSWDSADFGTYNLTLIAGKVKDAAGNTMAATSLGSFKVSVPLPGDANNNGAVEFGDLVILAQNYNLTGKTFAQGNFDDDPAGNVDFNDLVILAQRYGTSRLQLAPTVETTREVRPRVARDVLA